MPDSLSVTLAAGSAPYQKTLTSSLLRAGVLRRVLNLGPQLEVQEPDAHGSLQTVRRFPVYSFATRVLWAAWRRIPVAVRPRAPITSVVRVSDRLLARWITPTTIFHGRTANCLTSMHVAANQGAVTLVENASRHPQHWKVSEIEECRRFGMGVIDGSGDLAAPMMQRREQEFQNCDRIVVPSSVARQSFAEMGYGDKTVVVALGVDTNLFTPRHGDPPPIFRVCYVGRSELAKGIGYLLQAWKRLALPNAELLLVGAVRSQMKSVLKTYADASVRMTGFLEPPEVAKHYRESSVFVLPSPNEGFGLVLLEAMASGLPAIGTEMTGAIDCIENGKDGLIVPARNVDALADAILWCYRHPDESWAMGRAARAKVENQFSLEHYNQRVIALYRSLAM
jgi:glycosyltransferase involved in cell wall biosynthesis